MLKIVCHISESDLRDIVVIVSDNTPLKEYDTTEVCIKQGLLSAKPGAYLKLTCSFPIMGRYAIVMKDADEPMTLCEVLVTGELSTGQLERVCRNRQGGRGGS